MGRSDGIHPYAGQRCDLENGNERAEDEIVVYEVMVKRVDKLWWLTYKRDLETRFGQQEILIRVTAVDVIH